VPGLPTGTVTFLFTDVEGSTRLLQELGAAYADVLEEHERIVRYALAGHAGAEVDTQGDAFFAAFAGARDAVAAAEEIQRGLAETVTRVRIGLHTGEAELRGERYVGIDVHRAARICSAAHGGQVLMSQATHDLVDAETHDLGEHRLKDLLAPQRLYQLVVPGLPDDFPPPQTLERRRTNLPIQATPLVGRERELEEARALLLRGGRLLTLTGPGGTGKTRLALQLAADAVDTFDDGVFFVDLSAVREVELVLPAVAQAVGVRDASGSSVAPQLAEFFGSRRTLVVLDSVEQVVDSAPELGRLLAACPGLELVATSRVALRLTGEQEFPVPPLGGDEAVELFAERARAVRPGFELNGDRPAVAEICARLDGLPLAIELAAARVKLLPPAKLLERLDDRLALLTGGARDAPERHQTLRATIDWSYELLEEDERALLARLSVFAGGFTLEGAEAVCDASLDGIGSLVEKSLVAERGSDDAEPRFALLETVREYAHERLVERGEEEELGLTHAGYVLRSLEEGDDRGTLRSGLAAHVAHDWENVRAARAWFESAGDVERELRLAMYAYWAIWKIAGVGEVCGWLVRVLDHAADVDPGALTDAHGTVALAAYNLGDDARSRKHAERSLTLARELGDKRRIEWGLRATAFTERDVVERRRLLGECEALLREIGDTSSLGWIKNQEALTFELEGDWRRANASYEEAAAIFAEHGLAWEANNARLGVAHGLLAVGEPAAADRVAEDALRAAVALGSLVSVAEALVLLAAVRSETDSATAARLAAAGRMVAEREQLGLDRQVMRTLELAEHRSRERLGDRFQAEVEAGRALSLDDAVALALGSG
jgi:predicted ATPase/class 3 adenylate cyclase